MKRGEMIEKMVDVYVRRTMCESNLLYLKPEIVCHHLLEALEKNGMLPPITEFQMGNQKVRDNCWEPETEPCPVVKAFEDIKKDRS